MECGECKLLFYCHCTDFNQILLEFWKTAYISDAYNNTNMGELYYHQNNHSSTMTALKSRV